MRNQWRLLLLRSHSRSQPFVSKHLMSHYSQVHSLHSLSSSLLHSRAPHVSSLPHFTPQFHYPTNPIFRHFSSSELAVDHTDSDQLLQLSEFFSKEHATNDDITLELESNKIVITHELVLKALKNLNTAPDVAKRFFDWVLERESERLSSKAYNLMLGILGVNGFVNEFWDMVGVMKKKGYGVSKGTFIRASEKFEKEGLGSDIEKLKELYATGSVDNSIEKACSRICKVIRQEVWGDHVEKRLRELNVEFSSDLVAMVLANIGNDVNKALIFFRWVEESGLFKHDQRSYNAMAVVLGREDCVDKFWRVVNEMRDAGYEMEKGTYVKLLGRFVKGKMLKDAVDLYEFALIGENKPSSQDCTYLLRKVVVSKELDMDLFARVVRVCKENGNVLTNSTLNAVLKSISSVGRIGECNKILKALEECGLLPSHHLQGKIAFQLSSRGKKDEVREFMNNMESSGCSPNYKMWESLVEGHCIAGDLDKASDCFLDMVDKEWGSHAGFALELLVDAYCRKNRAVDASKLLSDVVNEKELKPWHTTYKVLLSKLLVQGRFKDALDLMDLMKSQGYPPFLDPFVEYISKTGTADDAALFVKSTTVKKFPSTSVFLRVFEAYFKAGRHNDAQDFLCNCPGYIRNHADVLNLFCSMKISREAASTTDLAA